jgi:tetratricopeptide (TPR) repeat protein
MTKEEALDLALEALENSVDLVREDAYNAELLYANNPTRQGKVRGLKVLADDHEKAITAIKQALALDKKAENARALGLDYEPDEFKCPVCYDKPAPVQEPPPWWPAVENILKEYGLQAIDFVADFNKALTAQRTWVGLTDEEIKAMDAGNTSNASFYAGALWAEAKLKEKNT